MKYLRDALICLLLALACLSLYKLTRLEDEAMATLTDVRRVTLSLGGISANVRQVSETLKKNSDTEVKLAIEASQQTNRDLADLDTAILRLNEAAGAFSHSLSQLDSSIAGVSAQSAASIKQVGDTVASLGPGIQALTETAQNSAKLTADPAIPATLASLESTTKRLDATAAHVEGTAADIEQAVHRSTRPASWAMRVGKVVLGLTVQAAQIAAGFFK